MEIHELQQLLSEMSLQEKIGQMVQLTGVYFDKEAVLTGVVGEQLPPEWIVQYAGSVLGRVFRFRWGRRVHFIRNWCLRRLL